MKDPHLGEQERQGHRRGGKRAGSGLGLHRWPVGGHGQQPRQTARADEGKGHQPAPQPRPVMPPPQDEQPPRADRRHGEEGDVVQVEGEPGQGGQAEQGSGGAGEQE